MTEQNTSFKDALQAISVCPFGMKSYRKDTFEITHTIRLALRLADRLTMEPSDEMLNKANQWCDTDNFTKEVHISIFKAMIAQLMKEVSE